jgi:hypothetical protein
MVVVAPLVLILTCTATARGNPAAHPGSRSPSRDAISLDPTNVKIEEGLISLFESTQPLESAFNADKTTPRFLAILSPTCPACRHGVEAIKDTLAADALEDNLRLHVVWTPMLEMDTEEAARAAAQLFSGLPVTQFYDPERRVGKAFRKDVFPRSADQMRQSLPPGHYLEASLKGRSNDDPEWDIYMFFDMTAGWTSATPRPAHWVRQIARVQMGEGGLVSVMWKDSYAALPIEGDLADQLRDSWHEVGSAGRK